MRGLEPALVLAALALALHGAYRFASGGPAERLTALFDIALAAVAASAVLLWREGKAPDPEAGEATGQGGGAQEEAPPPAPPDPVRDFLFYAVPALGAAAILWYLSIV